MAAFAIVAKVHEVPPGTAKVVVVAGHGVALFNVGGSFFALSNTCLHRGGPVGEGDLSGTTVACPWHGWEYDVTTGQNTVNPVARLKQYEVRVDGDNVLVATA
ncbi:MAG TPA: Rieske (2Fe-2S) protein [Thermoplasmata archaeon]|nr:Rieske (2Fe-2S) protein [Thermoplasmata archaeon]